MLDKTNFQALTGINFLQNAKYEEEVFWKWMSKILMSK